MSLLDGIASAIGHTPETLAEAAGTSVGMLESAVGGLNESGIDAFSAASRLGLTPEGLLRGIVTRMMGDPHQQFLSSLQAPVKPMSDPLASLTTLWLQMTDLHQNTARAIDQHIQDLFSGSGTESYGGPAAETLWNTHQDFQRYFTTLIDHAQTQHTRHKTLSGHADDYLSQMPGKVNSLPLATAALGVLSLDRALPSLGGPGQHQQMVQHGQQSSPSQDPWWQPAVDIGDEVYQEVKENPWEIPLLIAGLPDGFDEILLVILIIVILAVLVWAFIQHYQKHMSQQEQTKLNQPPDGTSSSGMPAALTPAQQQLYEQVKARLANVPGINDAEIAALVKDGYTDPVVISTIILQGTAVVAVFDDPYIAKIMNSMSQAEQLAFVQKAVKDKYSKDQVRAALNQWSYNHLQNTGNFRPGVLDHIFKGTNGSGYHYEGLPSANGTVVPGTETPPDKYGVYKADVNINGKPKKKPGFSTFFPKSMSPQDVVDSINEAYSNKTLVKGNKWLGHSASGMPIEMALDSAGKIISAWPV
jgi:hypothetical protein